MHRRALLDPYEPLYHRRWGRTRTHIVGEPPRRRRWVSWPETTSTPTTRIRARLKRSRRKRKAQLRLLPGGLLPGAFLADAFLPVSNSFSTTLRPVYPNGDPAAGPTTHPTLRTAPPHYAVLRLPCGRARAASARPLGRPRRSLRSTRSRTWRRTCPPVLSASRGRS
jgi:hypothetical protein